MLIPYLKSNNLLKLESPEKGVTDDTDDTDTDDTDTDHRRSRPSLMQPLDRWSMAAKKTTFFSDAGECIHTKIVCLKFEIFSAHLK